MTYSMQKRSVEKIHTFYIIDFTKKSKIKFRSQTQYLQKIHVNNKKTKLTLFKYKRLIFLRLKSGLRVHISLTV